jgi:hypothetical protein
LAGNDYILQATADRAKELRNLTNDEWLPKYDELAFNSACVHMPMNEIRVRRFAAALK